MGKQFDKARQLDDTYVMHTFARKPVEFVSGAGQWLIDDEGNEYLDFLSGIGVVSVGHCNTRVTEAVTEQANKLLHVSNYFYIEHRGELAERISDMLAHGTDGVWQTFFANSGAEANEGAIKLARLWGAKNLGGAHGIISAEKSFHGRTLATLAATAQDNKQDPFAPLPAGFGRTPLNDVDALAQALDGEVDGTRPCALMLECVQGESGVWPCTLEYLQAAREMTRERNMLLIVDEVQTGFCRTGSYFAFQAYGIEPDIVTMAKGIADGIPMGGFAAKTELASLMQPGMHGTTFGGGPLACAAADATTRIMCEEGFLDHVNEMGSYLRERLVELPFVTDVRGRGLMCGISLDKPLANQAVLNALRHGFVLNAPAADIIRLLPPLIIEQEDIDALAEALPTIYEEVAR